MKGQLLRAYSLLTSKINDDIKKNNITGINPQNYLGRMMNKKESIMNDNIKKTYLKNEFISHCRSGAIFGVIYPNGDCVSLARFWGEKWVMYMTIN